MVDVQVTANLAQPETSAARLKKASAASPAPKRNRDTITQALKAVTSKLRPDLDEDDLVLVRDTFLALLDRDRFRERKAKHESKR